MNDFTGMVVLRGGFMAASLCGLMGWGWKTCQDSKDYQVCYDFLKLGRVLISKIGLKANGKVKLTKIGVNKYEITKI